MKNNILWTFTVIFILGLIITSCSKNMESPVPTPSSDANVSIPKPSSTHAAEVAQLIHDISIGGQSRTNARQRLVALGREITGDLISNFNSEKFAVRWEIANILGTIQDPRAIEPLMEHALKDEAAKIRWRSLWALTQINDDSIPPRLLKALKSEDKNVQWHAAVGGSMFNIQEIIPILHEGIKSDDDYVVWEAINALARVNNETSVENLRPVLLLEKPKLRHECVLALGKMKYPSARDLLIKYLNDGDAGVRWRVAMGLANFNDSVTSSALEKQLKKETDPKVINQLKGSLKVLNNS